MNENFVIEFLNIESIIPYPNNPRINDKAVEPVAKSIKLLTIVNVLLKTKTCWRTQCAVAEKVQQ